MALVLISCAVPASCAPRAWAWTGMVAQAAPVARPPLLAPAWPLEMEVVWLLALASYVASVSASPRASAPQSAELPGLAVVAAAPLGMVA
ncbi:hypothetical protein ERJ75_000433200 [Trypanosoma vivax]|nr:hypothetical protein ERJ75_000433200 [Trypanosoma vivax]